MALTTQLTLKLVADLTSALDLSTPTDHLDLNDISFAWATGTGANQADQMFHDTRTLAASATEDLDLAGVLTNAFGAAQTFAKVKLLLIRAKAANTNNVNVQRAAANGFVGFLAAGDGLSLKPGGTFLITAPDANGIAVTASTGDLITITNSAGSTSVTYDVVIIGTSA